jgi:hypothetical protein
MKQTTPKKIADKIQNIRETIDNLMFLINEGDISPNEIYNRLEALDTKIERLEESL